MADSDGDNPQRSKLIVGGISAILLIAMIVGTAAFVLTEKIEDVGLKQRSMSSTMRTVDLFCAPADYRGTCQETLERALSNSSGAANQPHAAAAAAITAVERELAGAFNRSALLDAVRDSNDTKVQEALRDCRMLLDFCHSNVERALASIAWRGVDGPSQDLQAWLSAVITFQGSCVDMFPKGEIRDQVAETMHKAREISSNAIAIIQQGAALAAMLDLETGESANMSSGNATTNRRLEESASAAPSWLTREDRKLISGNGGRRKIGLTPNVTVAKDGSGDFPNITAALAAMPETFEGRYNIYVKEGVYDETVNITSKMDNVTMFGDGSRKTIVTGSKNVVDGIRMWKTATFAVDGDRFTAIRMGIQNTAGAEKQQAVALRVKADKAVFFNCRIEGHQDTLFAQAYRQFYRSCVIAGTVDFIFGDAAAVFQRCVLLVRPPLPGQPAVVTAHGRRDHQQTTGFVVHKSRILADQRLAASNASSESGSAATKTYLGRPWKEYARTVVMESDIEGFVHGKGYMPWEGEDNLGTAFFGEFGNAGDGSNITGRAEMKGFHVMGKDKAAMFTVGRFLHGAEWIPETGAPVSLGLTS
ncbi:hypothetical protein ACP70R_014314 [Stipagrostis hirtigluma subsp. patula]